MTDDCEIPDILPINPDRVSSAINLLDVLVLQIAGIFGMRENDTPNLTSFSGGIYASYPLSLH